MLHLPYQQLPHHQSQGNVSDCNVSDTVSESSDNATLMSLSLTDLTALGAGPIREDIRVNRKKLEGLIIRERDNPQEKPYMDKLMEASSTYIQWPSRMKIGAKTKKDLYVRVYGHNPDDVNEAKAQILADFGPHRDLRITLKMEISYTDHSHLIGCRGATIRRVMEDTGCHIHFPDSNRMSKDHKSNQVTIAGSSVQAVEQARYRVRELSPLLFQFMLPIVNASYEVNPDAHHVFIENIQSNYNVQVTIHPPNKLQQTSVTVKGCEIDAAKIKDAISKIVRYFSGGAMVSNLKVESTMEISAAQHSFVRSVNDSNIHSIMMHTGAKIIFPDLSDTNIQQIKRSRVYVSGDISCVYNARQQLIGCLPLRMIFDLADDFPLDWESVRMIGSELNVNVKLINRNRATSDRGGPAASLPPPIPGRGRTIQLIAAERNTANIYEARRRILGAMEPPASVSIPSTYALRPTMSAGNVYHYGNRLSAPPGPLPPLMLPPSPNMLSPVLSPSFWPPSPYASPFCSPPIATCVVNNGSGGTGGGVTPGDPPPGLTKMHGMSYNLSQGNHSYGFSSNLSTPVGPTPEFSLATMNAMKQSMHLSLTDNHSIKGFPTPANSTLSDSSLSSQPINALIQEFREFDLKRKAPGWERSNTTPNLFAKTPGATSSSNVSVISDGSVAGDPADTSTASAKAPNPMQDKKYLAVKAMYNSKIGPNPRIPTAEWAGCGFSRTHLNLFPQEECNTALPVIDGGDSKANNNDDEKPSSSGLSWTDASIKELNSGEGGTASNTTASKPKDCSTIHKPPLGHQQSNLLDFSVSRTTIDRKLTDLPSLFIENGLEKYIHLFMSEEIDLESFAALTEADLRALGVSSYPARKKMQLLITALNYSQADPKDNWD
ncbi:unnamed protein product [Orchesella dallaii]|uniref:SAM domain-containing protein n=1 Tax=Orchesella dallaii TaxID=48710 RepID=A0ABP1QXC5_9HEXA